MANWDQELDASGLNCPLPILRAKKALAGLQSGQVLHVIATYPGSVNATARPSSLSFPQDGTTHHLEEGS